MKIPADIHQRVVDLTNAMIDAGQSGDVERAESLYGELSRYCESVAAEGRDHPFLWETLGDFTDDDRDAIDIYLRALPLASAANAADYAASICLAVAERHSNLDELERARSYALQADTFARSTDDLPLRAIISQFLLDHADAADEH